MIKSGKSHCVITGPNKGGKSSVLRALLLNIRLAQRFGIAFATSMDLRPFDWIESGLRLADQPGSQSLFERELSFASKLLQKCADKTKVGLILYDECFHSTNPPDGQKTAELFLQNLWTHPNIGSAVSTHVFSLLEKAPVTVKKLCVPASQTPSGLVYQFALAPGICTVSSVEELYEKHKFPKTAGKQGI
jgi:DNA mismatch repair ATPase MutS